MNLAILLALLSTNQRLPSEPAVMPTGPLKAVGVGYSVMAILRDSADLVGAVLCEPDIAIRSRGDA